MTTNKFKFIDLEYLKEVSSGDTKIMVEFIDIFNDQIPKFENDMMESLHNKNWEVLALTAHTAKSSVTIMGLNDLGTRLKQLELKARKVEDIDTFMTDIEQFSTITKAAMAELATFVKEVSETDNA